MRSSRPVRLYRREYNIFSHLCTFEVHRVHNLIEKLIFLQVTNHLFISSSKIFGQDLVAIDILRGRDFGMPPYNVFRKACGLCPIESFQGLESIIMNPAMVSLPLKMTNISLDLVIKIDTFDFP